MGRKREKRKGDEEFGTILEGEEELKRRKRVKEMEKGENNYYISDNAIDFDRNRISPL